MNSIVSQAVRERRLREASYRERALKLFDHVCGRCGREFEGRRLRELTVHHRDHDHDNNPADGSNWELLCIYCHENEHSRNLEQDLHGTAAPDDAPSDRLELENRPFAGLADLLADTRRDQSSNKK